MKVCDVVLDSVWWDPRVRKQIYSYTHAEEIEFVCIGFKDKKYNAEEVEKLPCKVKIVELPEQMLGQQKGIYRKVKRDIMTYRAIKKTIISEKPDIIHCNNLDILMAAYSASRVLKCKLIYDSFEINVENYIGKRRNILAFFYEKIERYIVRRVDLMIAVSNAAAEYFSTRYGIERPIVVTNSVLCHEIIYEPRYKKEFFEILNHGQFYEGRGYDIMTRAVPLLRDYPQLHLAVRGFGKLEQEMRKTVAASENAEQFHFYPKVRVDELIPKATESNVGVAITVPICLNFKLSVSNKLFEYAAAGLPVIMSDIPEHRYLNNKYNFGIIISENTPEAFADSAIKLYTDTKLYSQLSKNAIMMSEAENWDVQFMKLIEMEKKLVK